MTTPAEHQYAALLVLEPMVGALRDVAGRYRGMLGDDRGRSAKLMRRSHFGNLDGASTRLFDEWRLRRPAVFDQVVRSAFDQLTVTGILAELNQQPETATERWDGGVCEIHDQARALAEVVATALDHARRLLAPTEPSTRKDQPMPAKSSAPAPWTSADVVMVAAIGEEYQAVLRVDQGAAPGGHWEERTFHGLPVARRDFVGRGGQTFTVVVGRAADMGKGPAVAVLRPLVDALAPSCVAMSGVCGGDPGKTKLGDVIAGERIYDYDAGKQLALDRQAEPAGSPPQRRFRADPRVYSVPASWKVALERFDAVGRFAGKDWLEARPVPYEWQEAWVLWQLHHGVADPKKLPEATRMCAQWPKVVKRLWDAGHLQGGTLTMTEVGRARISALSIQYNTFPDLSPTSRTSLLPFKLRAAVIGTGSPVVEDPGVWDEIHTHMRKVEAIEMECAALADVVRSREDLNLRAVAMKGIMDLTNEGRDDQFKEFAAIASAECLLAFLCDQMPDRPRPAAQVVEPTAVAAANVGAGSASAGATDTAQLLDRLSRVNDPMFEKLVLLSRIDRNLIRANNASLGDRIVDVVQLATHDPDLCRRLHALLDHHAPWTGVARPA